MRKKKSIKNKSDLKEDLALGKKMIKEKTGKAVSRAKIMKSLKTE